MSLNWVMLSPSTDPPYTPLPHEQTLFSSPPRIGFSLSAPSNYPGKQQQAFSLTNAAGVLYLTNRRLIYLPDKETEKLKSFAAPILNLHDSHVTAPFFGANVWTALLQPVQGGGIPVPSTGVIEIKLTFKEGGAFDFHTKFEQVKERLQQAVEVSRMDGDGARAALNGVDVSNVNLDDLPAYQEASDGPLLSPIAPLVQQGSQGLPRGQQRRRDVAHPPRDSGVGVEDDGPQPKPADGRAGGTPAPVEPPPGYEEVQMQGVRDEVDRRLSDARER